MKASAGIRLIPDGKLFKDKVEQPYGADQQKFKVV
ncbi:MAG: hypothetical protein JWP44_291 [Mucilaginibacter sp.]|nr:hypothetical protein [Mucilaginibacter sp.]